MTHKPLDESYLILYLHSEFVGFSFPHRFIFNSFHLYFSYIKGVNKGHAGRGHWERIWSPGCPGNRFPRHILGNAERLASQSETEESWLTETDTNREEIYYRLAEAQRWRGGGLRGRHTDSVLFNICAYGISAAAAWKTWQWEDVCGLRAFIDHRHEWVIPHEHTTVCWNRCKNKNSFTSAAALQEKFAIHTPQLLWHARGHITLESDTWSLTSSPDDPRLTHRRSAADPSGLKASLGPHVWRTYGLRYHLQRTFLQHVGDTWNLNAPHELFTYMHMCWKTDVSLHGWHGGLSLDLMPSTNILKVVEAKVQTSLSERA